MCFLVDNLGGGLFEEQPEMTLPPAVQENMHSQPPVLDREGMSAKQSSISITCLFRAVFYVSLKQDVHVYD